MSQPIIWILESITALNNSMKEFKGVILFTSHDHQLVNTVANRVIELTPNGIIDKMMSYDDYIKDSKIIQLKRFIRLVVNTENQTIRYSFSIEESHKQYLKIRVDFPSSYSFNEIKIPVWRPGRYEIGNFAKNIKGL